MAKMVNPELEVVRFENEDVIAGPSSLYWNANTRSFTDRQGKTYTPESITEELWDGNTYTTASEFVKSENAGSNNDWRLNNGAYDTYGSGS